MVPRPRLFDCRTSQPPRAHTERRTRRASSSLPLINNFIFQQQLAPTAVLACLRILLLEFVWLCSEVYIYSIPSQVIAHHWKKVGDKEDFGCIGSAAIQHERGAKQHSRCMGNRLGNAG